MATATIPAASAKSNPLRRLRTYRSLWICAALACWAGAGSPAHADDGSVVLRIKDHVFQPQDLTAAPGERIKILVRNEDGEPAEFESVDFHREKIIQPGHEITVHVGPLAAGDYEFFDDFHPQTRGHLHVRAPADKP